MNNLKIFLTATVFLILVSVSWGAVPNLINFQGILTDTLGNPVPDGNYSVTFRIYDAASAGNIIWQEAQLVTTSQGLFTYILGSATPIPDTVFKSDQRWLGIQIGSNPELSPRTRLTSTPFAYVGNKADSAANADLLDGMNSSDFATVTHNHDLQYAALAHNHDTTYVNVIGPDSVVSSSGTAFLGSASGSSSIDIIGVSGVGRNSSTGNAFGGIFSTSSSGTGYKYGVYGSGLGNTASDVYGVSGYAQNSGSGFAYAGYFLTSSAGTGVHYGVAAQCNGTTTNATIGMIATAINTSSGSVYGGRFNASQDGTGIRYGVYGDARSGSTGAAIGSYGIGYGFSSSDAYGGFFTTASTGTGIHYSVYGTAFASSSSETYGIYGSADNNSNGSVYAGYFYGSPSGTGLHYGVYGVEASGGSGAAIYAAGDMVASGTKSAVVKTSAGERLYYTIESPEIWFEDFGEGQLANGKAHIELGPLFLETVTINASNPMKVFIQLKDDCKGTYVKTYNTGFDVIELQNGNSNASFSYRLVAKRKGYETQRLPQTTLGMDDPNLYPELWQEIEKRHQEAKVTPQIEK